MSQVAHRDSNNQPAVATDDCVRAFILLVSSARVYTMHQLKAVIQIPTSKRKAIVSVTLGKVGSKNIRLPFLIP